MRKIIGLVFLLSVASTNFFVNDAFAQWVPPVFNPDVQKFPPNYVGVDPVKFYDLFKSKLTKLVKGEFETTAAFEARKSQVNTIIKPINTDSLYAFRMNDVKFKYDPDSQQYYQEEWYSLYCHQGLGDSNEYAFCRIKNLWRKHDTYIGRNGFGATKKIDRSRGKDFSLAIKKSSLFFHYFFSVPQYSFDRYRYLGRIDYPIESAKKLKSFTISTVIVGYVTEAKIYEDGELKEPKMDSPSDIFIQIDGVPFDAKRIIHYVLETGEILYDSDKQ